MPDGEDLTDNALNGPYIQMITSQNSSSNQFHSLYQTDYTCNPFKDTEILVFGTLQ